MDATKQKQNMKRGLTMVEMIVVIALFGIVMTAVTQSIFSFYRMNGYTIAQAYQVSHARQGIEHLVRDLREMTYADDGAFPLVVMDEYRVGFYSDIDRDNSVEYVEYQLSTTTTILEKKIYNATGSPITYNYSSPDTTTAISEYVQNDIQSVPIFVYYDWNGNSASATTTVADVRYVQLSVIVNIDPVRDPDEFVLRSSASLRNLKSTQ